MCGIYCSDNENTFDILKDANHKRGNFATGLVYISECDGEFDVLIGKGKGKLNVDSIPTPINCKLFLGHNQAPTSKERLYKARTTHPFTDGDWVVAHNGVLTNFDKLLEDHVPGHINPVDSSIIPALLDENDFNVGPSQNDEEEVCNIMSVLELLEGTFAVWMYNKRTNNLFIARQGSTLFYKGTHVSSIKGADYIPVSEGTIYRYTPDGFKAAGEFMHKSPFLTL